MDASDERIVDDSPLKQKKRKRAMDTDQVRRYVCKVKGCAKHYESKSRFISHLEWHIKVKSFVCSVPLCEASFTTQRSFKAHMNVVHINMKPFVCEICSKGFATNQLTVHLCSHSADRPYCCAMEGCNGSFSTSAYLKLHVNSVHLKIRPFVCEICSKSFATNQKLIRHSRSHSEERRFQCEVNGCTKVFASVSNLHIHLLVHADERKFICKICGKSFKQPSGLTGHKQTHLVLRPFICLEEGCDQTFVRLEHFRNHSRIHSGIRPFACEHCGKCFTHLSNKAAHEKMHEIQKSYEYRCPMQDGGTQFWRKGDIQCSIRCKTPRHLEFHVERNHTLEGVGRKLDSEEKLAKFLEANGIEFQRDFLNRIDFKQCRNIEGSKCFARPDFFLPVFSAKLQAIVILGNDEFAHRYYPCDFQRIFNIANALEQNANFKGVPILYIRFNPHHYQVDGIMYNPKLEVAHQLLLSTLESITTVRPGVNLVYVNYDSSNGGLDIFDPDKSEGNDFVELYRKCVLLSVCSKLDNK